MSWRQSAWEAHCTDRLPPAVAEFMLQRARHLHGLRAPESSSPWHVGNQWLIVQKHRFQRVHLGQAYDEKAIRDLATNRARLCERIRAVSSDLNAQLKALERREQIAQQHHVPPPSGPTLTIAGRLARLESAHWWRRQLRKVWTREAENGLREVGLIRRGRAPYASDVAVAHRHEREQRKQDFLQRYVMVNELTEQLPLFELAERSLANPALRRGEFMCRIRGMEEIAHAMHHAADFWTLTVPSAFHAQLAAAGDNPAYERQTVRDAQAWLCKLWAKARSWMRRKGVRIYGVRVAEPHHDATPHWHLLVFGKGSALELLREYLPRLWLSDRPHEPGASAVRTQCERIRPEQGSAVGYVAKYISKNIDAAGSIGPSEDLETGATVHASSIRVLTWAQVHGIRQFQQIGAPPIGLWRETRRLREAVVDPDIETARTFADRGDYCRFVQSIGGIHAGRRTNLKLRKEDLGTANQYTELRPPQVVGLQWASSIVLTRPHRWRIQKCNTSSNMEPSPLPFSCGARRASTSVFDGGITKLSVFGPQTTIPLGLLRKWRDATAPATTTSSGTAISPNSPTSSSRSKPSIPTPCPSAAAGGTRRSEDSASESGSFPALGPVAITVRGRRYLLVKSPDTGIFGWWPQDKLVDSS